MVDGSAHRVVTGYRRFLSTMKGVVWFRSCSERRGGQSLGGRIGGLLVELGGVEGFVLVAVP